MTHKHTHLPLVLALALALSPLPQALALPAPATLAQLERNGRLDQAAVDQLYRQAMRDGDLEALYRQLAERTGTDAGGQAMALLAKASLEWRGGQPDAAMADVDHALTLAPGPDGWLLKARLTDVAGQAQAAEPWYRKTLQASADPAERAALQRRVALIRAQHQPSVLSASMPGQPDSRVALVASLLGDPAQALVLEHAAAGGRTRNYHHQIRSADWAIAAGDSASAREYAWAGFVAAANAQDQRYALALLVESFRNQAALAGALAFLDARPSSIETIQVKVDILLELGRDDAAIALVRGSTQAPIRERLLSLLEASDRVQEVEAEYLRLIAEQPHQPDWCNGLAAIYLSAGEKDRALALYTQFFAHNVGRVEVLGQAVRQMIAMGLQDQAIALMKRSDGGAALTVPAQLFLFQTYLNQNEPEQASAVLSALEQQLPVGHPAMAEIVDGYERLGRKDQAQELLARMERASPLGYDQQVHLATLLSETGHADQALTRWRAMWSQSRLPARQQYLEKQVIRLATDAGKLDALAQELEQRVASGQAARSELNLLVGIRLEQRDREAAVAAVARYAAHSGQDRVQTLNQLGVVYARLHDNDRFDQNLRELATVDAANADLHLRNLVLNVMEHPEAYDSPQAQRDDADALLTRLNGRTGLDQIQALRFTAGVYASAGQGEQAITLYRRILAQAPGSVEDMGQLAKLLRDQQRQGEAAAMLESAAETAPDQPTFVAAISGLIDLFAAAPGNEAPPPPEQAQLARGNLLWARRMVLERLLVQGDGQQLYPLLADVAEALHDDQTRLRAYAEMLPLADDQRASILRRLVSVSSDPAGPDAGTAHGDPVHKLIYGRRLLALKREYPPELYADLAASLLDAGDVPGAERAFALLTSVGGLVNVEEIKGDAYLKAGDDKRALANYGRALLGDQNNFDLIVKTSILQESQGNPLLANQWYAHGLETLLSRQPQMQAGDQEDAQLDRTRYYPTLVEGLLLTRAAQLPDAQQAFVESLQRRLQAALQKVDRSAPAPFKQYPQLTLVADLIERVAGYDGDQAQLQRADAALAAVFGPDRGVARSAGPRVDARAGASAGAPPDQFWAQRGLALQAREQDNFGLRLAVALQLQDRPALAGLIGEAFDNERRMARGAAEHSPEEFGPALLYAVIVECMDRLPRTDFNQLVLEPLQAEPYRDRLLFDIYRTAPERYARLERISARPLVTDQSLMQMILRSGNERLPQYDARRLDEGRAGLLDNMLARFGLEQKLALYQSMVDDAQHYGASSAMQQTLIGMLLAQPLDSGQQRRFAAALLADVGVIPEGAPRTAAFAVPKLLMLDVAPVNRPLLLEAARTVASRYPDGARLPEVLEAYFGGDHAGAYSALRQLYADTSRSYRAGDYTREIVSHYLSEQPRREIEQFLGDPHPTQAQAQAFYQQHIAGPDAVNPSVAERVRYYAKLLSVDPQNPEYLTGLLNGQWATGDLEGVARTLARYCSARPQDREAAALLALVARLDGQASDASPAAQALGDPAWFGQLLERGRGAGAGGFAPLVPLVYAAYQARFPDDPLVLALHAAPAQGSQPQGEAGADDPGVMRLVQTLHTHPDRAARQLRQQWRRSAPGGDSDHADSRFRQALLDTLRSGDPAALPGQDPGSYFGSPEAAAALFQEMAADPRLIAETEAYLRALPPQLRRAQQVLYDVLVSGLIKQGGDQARLQRLLAQLSSGELDAHGLQLLATLVNQTAGVLDPAQGAALIARLQESPADTAAGRIQLAGVFALAHDHRSATALLEAAALQILFPSLASSEVDAGPPATMVGLVGVLGRWQDRAAAERAYAAVQSLVRAQRSASASALPDDFPALPAQAQSRR